MGADHTHSTQSQGLDNTTAGGRPTTPVSATPASATATFTCPICFDDEIAPAAVVDLCDTGGCRFCIDCAWRCCKAALDDGLVPACPHDREKKCGVLSRTAAELALTRFLLEDRTQTQARKAELTSWGVRGSAAAGYRAGKLDEVYLAAERARSGAVQCIGKGCKEWYVPPIPHSSRPQRLTCTKPKCGVSFCAACRQPYHFRSDCAEALRIHARWVRYLTHELKDFATAAVKVEPDRYGPLLKLLAKSKGAMDDSAREALGRFDELRKMEQWKEKHCRHCPGCARVVEKLSGCDAMVCGTDAHGGNEQRGCGKRFSWQAARPYRADLRSAADEGSSTDGGIFDGRERRLQLDAREEHLLVPGAPLQCDGCAEPLVGPRLQCVQCVGAVELCVTCIVRDSATKKPLLLRDGTTKHPKGHVFRRVRQPPSAERLSAGASRVVNLTDAASTVPDDPAAPAAGTSGDDAAMLLDLTQQEDAAGVASAAGSSAATVGPTTAGPAGGGWYCDLTGPNDTAGGTSRSNAINLSIASAEDDGRPASAVASRKRPMEPRGTGGKQRQRTTAVDLTLDDSDAEDAAVSVPVDLTRGDADAEDVEENVEDQQMRDAIFLD